MVPALIRPHPLSARGQRVDEFPEGVTVAQIVAVYFPAAVARAHVVVFVGSRQVPAEYWERVRPKAGVMVRVAVVLGGSGDAGRKQMLSAVAMIVISAFSAGAGAALYGAGTAGAYAFAATATMIGSLIVNSLFK